jgi:hypothetical protein
MRGASLITPNWRSAGTVEEYGDTNQSIIKLTWSCFYKDAVCCCGYLCGVIYIPDLLNGPSKVFECKRCHQKFSVSTEYSQNVFIRGLMDRAEEHKRLMQRVIELEDVLKQKQKVYREWGDISEYEPR